MRVVRLVVDRSEVEVASDVLWRAGASAVHEADLADGRVGLTADVADPDVLDDRWPAEAVEADHDALLDAWRAWASPVRAGERVVISPAWLGPPEGAGPDDIVVDVDPGRAFGSGSHVSTRQAVAALERDVWPGCSVLDVGCGSGVLAVVAARLGARGVVAVDVDPAAVQATAANAAANGVAVRVEASTTPVAAVRGAFDVVVANIGVGVLVEEAAAVAARVADGGGLVLAGLLDGQADRVVVAYPGFTEVARVHEEGWACVRLRRDGSA